MLFIAPPLSAYKCPELKDRQYVDGTATYAEYNYLRAGIASRVKIRHFELALRATRGLFGNVNAIDFGCADGVFLPSLSRYYDRVLGIDVSMDMVEVARIVVESLHLRNVSLLCNRGLSFEQLRGMSRGEIFRVAYALEVLEHVGQQPDPWGSRVLFLKGLFSLLDEKGIVVVSVPKMTGMSFLWQRIALALLGCRREPLSWRQLFRAVVFKDTSELESRWNGDHLGFNHVRLEEQMRAHFEVVERIETVFQVVYVLRAR